MHVGGVNLNTMRISDIGRFTDTARILLRKEFFGNQNICRSRDFFKRPQRE